MENTIQETGADEKNAQLLLHIYRNNYERQKMFAENRIERIKELMQRPSAQKLSREKQLRMVRRYEAANKSAENAEKMIEQIDARIEQMQNKSNTDEI